MRYSSRDELKTILDRTTTGFAAKIEPVMTRDEILGAQKLVRRVIVAPHVQDYLVRLAMATHPGGEFATDMTGRYVRWGSSPRGAQALSLAAKVHALLDGRFNVSFADVQRAALPALRHRVLLNFEGEAENLTTDAIIEDLLAKTPTVADQAA